MIAHGLELHRSTSSGNAGPSSKQNDGMQQQNSQNQQQQLLQQMAGGNMAQQQMRQNQLGNMMGGGNMMSGGNMMGSGGMMGGQGMMGNGMIAALRPEELAEMPAGGVFMMMGQTCSACHTKFRTESK